MSSSLFDLFTPLFNYLPGIRPEDGGKKKKRKIRISFNDDEEVINPEDIDPSVGRFRNMIESTVIPKKVRSRFSQFE